MQESEPAHVLSQKAETVQGSQEDRGSFLADHHPTCHALQSVCYFGNSKKADTERLDKVTRRAAKMVGAETTTPSTSYGNVALKKLLRILSDTQHPLNHVLFS